MFQSFEVTSTPQFGRDRTCALRTSFDALGIDAFLVPAPTNSTANMCRHAPSAWRG
jgi:hypothetical protein